MLPARHLLCAPLLGLLVASTALAQEPSAESPDRPQVAAGSESSSAGQEKAKPEAGAEAPEKEGAAAAAEPQKAGEKAEKKAGEKAKAAAAPPPPVSRCPASSIDFELPFPAERGGGTVKGCAGALEMEKGQQATLSGGVDLHYQDIQVRADRVQVDLGTKVVTAQGEVILDQGPRRITGATLTFDLQAKTGSLTQATAYVAPDYYFSGAEVDKVGDDVYTVTDGTFTSCSGETPAWSFKLSKGRVTVDGYARVKNASMRIKKVPVLYTPYLLWPVKQERTSGLLVPQPSYSQRHGFSLSLAYYQVLGRSYDTTLELDTYQDGFIGLGNELRYRPSENTKGNLVAYAIEDRNQKKVRWKVDWEHETRDLPWGLRGVVSYHDFSDFQFFRDFERDFNRNTIRFLDSRGFITGNWGPHLVNLLINRRETFINPETTIVLSKLPELEYRLRPTKLGPTPFYLRLDSSLDYLSQDRPGNVQGSYGRIDLFPQVTLPVRSFPWLSVSLTAGERFTLYGDSFLSSAERASLTPEERQRFAQDPFTGNTLTRTIPFGSAEIVGPSFSRIFGAGGNGAKYKHVIEPRFTYTFLDRFADPERVPLFDEVDTVNATNVGRFSLVNRLLAKPAGDGGSAREVLLFQLSQDMSFDSSRPLQRSRDGSLTSSRGPLSALLRFNPSEGTSLKTEVSYNTLFKEIESTSLTGSYNVGGNYVGLTWFTRRQAEQGQTVSNQVRLSAGVNVLPGKLRIEGQINYDFELQLLQQQRYIIDYLSQCYGLRFEIRDFQSGTFHTTDYRIAFSLKNVGTFLDLTGGLSREPQ